VEIDQWIRFRARESAGLIRAERRWALKRHSRNMRMSLNPQLHVAIGEIFDPPHFGLQLNVPPPPHLSASHRLSVKLFTPWSK